MTHTLLILASILVLTSGAWGLLRAYRQRSVLLALNGVGLIALSFSLSALRVGERAASGVFSVIAIATYLAAIFWRTPTVPTGESRWK